MRFKYAIPTAVLAMALLTVPAQAAADRSAAKIQGEGQFAGGSTAYVLGFFAILAIGLGVYLSTDDSPASP